MTKNATELKGWDYLQSGAAASRQYVFNDVDDLATYLCKVYPAITPIKLQKGLYFLYAYYVGVFPSAGTINEVEGTEFEDVSFYPPELFKPEFHAWQLGPVIPEVYRKFKEGFYAAKVEQLEPDVLFPSRDPLFAEMKLFVDDFFLKRVCCLNDFVLVDRVHTDKAWIETWGDGSIRNQPINPELIKSEYVDALQHMDTMYA